MLLALALWAGHAPAQTNVCRGGPPTGSGNIACIESSGAADILIAPGNAGIDHSTNNEASILARHGGTGGIEFRMTAGTVVGRGTATHGMYARHDGATGGGAIVIRMSGGSIETRGSGAFAIWGRRAGGTGNIRIDVTGGSLSRTGGTGDVVLGQHGGTGNVSVSMSGGAATGTNVGGLAGAHSGTGNIAVSMTGGSIATSGVGVTASKSSSTAGNITVTVAGANTTVKTTGSNGHAVNASNSGAGSTAVTVKDGLIETSGGGARGINAYSNYTGTNPGAISVVMEGGAVRTSGGAYFDILHAHGIYAESNNGRHNVSVRMTGGSVETAQASANGIIVLKRGPAGAGSIEMTGGSVRTAGDGARGAYVYMYGTGASTEGLSIDAAGAVSAEGLNARGLAGFHLGLGSATITTRAAAEIEAPFAVGMEGRLTSDTSAAGRIVVTHGGAVEARDVGVLAWAARSSGHTMGSGATTANDAARTTPMIHVTSSGNITVGAPVTEAFIRARIAGDGGLSTLEEAVLTAITDNDSGALTTALAALPASYDAAWKAEAQDLRRKRAAVTTASTDNAVLGHRAAEEILGLARAGIRASALSHTAIADYVRGSDALSTAERTALTAVLTGDSSGLTTALTALTGAAYTTAWKNTVRQHALTYNAGDIQVGITGGSITADGNGVEAFYAVPHDSNGDIAVTVSAGARVTGGARGIYVRGAGVTAGARNQAVTVHGAAMGGTGAGVHAVGGGAVTVGAGGEVGTVGAASSGIGILGDGGGDLTATVSGTVTGDIRVNGGGDLAATVKDGGTVTGDLRVGGSGSLTATVEAGGAVEGTIRDPQASFTVSGSVGRVLYASGGAVTVAGGAKLTGVSGTAIESTAGALTVTVQNRGRVEADIESGGTLMVTVNDGGVVTGTIEDPQASFTVGSGARIGRILYTTGAGGTVTVSGGGTLTGVEGVAAESTDSGGALTVTVNDEGRVEGDVKSGGTLSATVDAGGVVTGTIHDPQASFTVSGSVGRVLYASGGTVTVAGGAKLTGVGGTAIESTAGALTVTVNDNGRVEGDVKSAGTLSATVNDGGVVTGTIHNPQASFTVAGGASIGRILYASGGTVTVAGGAKLTGVEGVAVESTASALTVTVNDEGRVEGDVKSGGTLSATVNAGGVVTGTIHNPQTPFTVSGSVGRVLYAGGGAVTVSAGGTLTGVAGVAVESTAGALTVTVSNRGRVEGGIESGGTLTANVMAGGVVTGTLRNPQSPLTVSGSVGRILYARAGGGTVTVAGGGAVLGVEVDGATEAIRGNAGNLDVTVAARGMVTGLVEGRGAGNLKVTVAGSLTGGIAERAAGDLEVSVAGTVTGGIRGEGAGEHTVTVASGGAVTGTVHLATGAATIAGRAARLLYDNGGMATVAAGGEIAGVEVEGTREAIRNDAGNLEVTVASDGEVAGRIEDRGEGHLEVEVSGAVTGGIVEREAGNLDVTVTASGAVTGTVEGRDAGNLKAAVSGDVTGDIVERGAGDLDVTVSATVTGGVVGEGAGAHKVSVESAGAVTGTVRLPGNAETTVAGKVGRVHYDNGGAVTVNANGEITGLEIEGVREAVRGDAGDLAITVHGTVTGNIEARGDGDLTVMVSETGTIAGEIFGRGGGVHTIEIADKARVVGTVHNPKRGTTISGAVGRVLFDNGGALTIAASGRVSGVGGEAIRSAAGDLEVAIAGEATGNVESRGGALAATVTGTVEGDILGLGAGEHTVAVRGGGMVTGTVRLAAGEADVDHGAAGRVLLDRGGSVKVGARGEIKALEVEGVREAIRSDAGDLTVAIASGGAVKGRIEARGAGDLTVTVAGAVSGDIRGLGAGVHRVTVASGGSVAGAIRGAGAGSHAATVAGRAARVLYENGGSVTVASGGAVLGVETSDGGREAIRGAAGDLAVEVAAMGTVAGDIRGAGDGDLDVDVSGTVRGGIFGLGGGEHDVHVKSGGSVEGLIHLAASTVTVEGSARSVLFDRGGTVSVGAGGRLSNLDGRAAVRSEAGDLMAMVNGNVTGNIEGMGAGALMVTVANELTGGVIGGDGGMHRLTVASGGTFKGHVEGLEAIRIAGRAEAARPLTVSDGGEVTVAAGGVLMGAEDAQGRRVAVSVATGALNMTVEGEGMVEGAVEARDAAAASTVTVDAGGAIDGRVALAGAGSEVTVDGAAQSVDVPRGAVTVGENGSIAEPVIGAETVTIRAAAGETDEEAALRLGGGRIDAGNATITLKRQGRVDSRLRITRDGRIEVGPAPRHRVYEALPSALLALNALPAHGDRFASAGAPRGAFARLDAAGGERHPASSVAQAHHDYRRFGFEAGIEGAAGERGVFAISVHHVRGRADVDTDADTEAGGGRVEITGTGARISGAWLPAENIYVSAQAAATLYEADLDSASAFEGALARDLSGRGYAAGVEIGRRLELGRVTLTPRAGADWSMVEMSSFTDSVNERVSLDAGRRITARAGVRAESAALPGGAGAMFATLDLERELSGAMETTAADRPFEAEAEATWARLGLGAAHEWADGRIALRANANYAAARHGNRDFSGSATLTVRF